ncbi:sodium channel protein Nach [Bicyclus anynana]|uniref:Sodium channel protein Nach n=1 Tax=Bicyclus anynana TaxID=110368 RepID=A0ABM3LQZ7_BICAN|nr:sodium channel protein Nach [Bicyclus anynana]
MGHSFSFGFKTRTVTNVIDFDFRLFWLCFVILSWYGSSLLIEAQYRAFQNNPISFVVETTYKDWNTRFPSIAVCENDNSIRIENVSDSLWGPDHDFNMEEVLKEISYFKGVTYYTSEYCREDDPLEECFTNNLTYYAGLLRSSCREVMSNCSWNNKSFDCCTYFRPMETEFGTCFVINSIQSREKNPPKYEMTSNRTSRLGMIKFHVTIPVKVYTLNEEEMEEKSKNKKNSCKRIKAILSGYVFRRLITVRNIENDADARFISPEKRKCRYIDENNLQVYPYYSYTACTVQCRKDAQMRLCNCSNFFMPNTPEEEKCNTSGVICMNYHADDITVLKASWSNQKGLYCDCLPSCTEAEISVVKDIKEPNVFKYSTVQIELSSLPSEMYRRNVVRGVLDLVVSTGGTGGLFLGASILSFVELLYILLIRPFCDVYKQRHDDPWHRKFGTRQIQDNHFALNRNIALKKP